MGSLPVNTGEMQAPVPQVVDFIDTSSLNTREKPNSSTFHPQMNGHRQDMEMTQIKGTVASEQ